ncbi:MAG: hypothetical protein VYB15_10945 [Planctomycetota bacterium]|nr:hypothetical protein [Planctomycetota bacterium]
MDGGKERSAPPGCTSETQKLREDNTAYLNRFAKRENDSIYGRAAAKKIADPEHVVNSASTNGQMNTRSRRGKASLVRA